MQYFSTNHTSPPASFKAAVLSGQPLDGGLYFPEIIPPISNDFLETIETKENDEIAFEVMRPFVAGDIPDDILRSICSETVDFPFPLVQVSPDIETLELFHGPTLAFKDVGARFMSRCLKYFTPNSSEKTVVITATSGDTGGAVANGFFGVDGVEVVILYPKGRVSRVQELQLTTLGGNVTALALEGSFDDCQALAKQALVDDDLKQRVRVTSANSINIARWLPQQIYYFFGCKLLQGDEPPVISVPSGNFGNICSGLLAWARGLPVKRFIAACNANDVIPKYLQTGEFKSQAAIHTISNAMDVGDPSNFARILELLGPDPSGISKIISAVSISDAETEAVMRDVFERYSYVMDPHGAVAYKALADHHQQNAGESGIFLETAHPVKFDAVKAVLGNYDVIPDTIQALYDKPDFGSTIDANYGSLKEVLLSRA
ncbi:MAG: threonine synthase [Acidobacteriota bacterium]